MRFSRLQIMWLKIVCVLLIARGVLAKRDELLDSMYGLQGGNKMALCVSTPSGWRRCDGALYTRDWVLARARCVASARAADLRLQQLARGGSCERLANGTWDMTSTRQVYRVVMHPWFDLALAAAVRPYSYLDGHANATKIRLKLKPHGVYKWMKYYFDITALSRNRAYQAQRMFLNQQTRHYPMWYICVTMVLPSVLLILFFIYVTFYTGNTVPYKEMHYSKKVTHV